MIYSQEQLEKKILELIDTFENEVVEFKEAKNSFSFNDIGKYFSALSNEANLRDCADGWLVFGVKNNRDLVGSSFRKDGNLQSLKKELIEGTNERLTFREIYDVELNGNRLVVFQIPPATRGIPTTWRGAAYAREGESLCPLPVHKFDEIRHQVGMDWSKEIVEDASYDDLDPEAVSYARQLFSRRQQERIKAQDILERWTDSEVLDKAGLTIRGKITRTALLLLGRSESTHFFDGFIPRITWTLYNADNSVKAYEHFDPPMLLAIDKVFAKIRNERYRYIAGQQTLFPEEVTQYDADLIKELLNNCLAHSDFSLRGKINVEEFEDRLVFINEGYFIPETIEKTLTPGYKPPYYRNSFLCKAMVNLYMIDTNSMGIPRIFQIQRDKSFPLPSYDLDTINRVQVTVYGKILDKNYTQLLHANDNLDIQTVFLLDRVQKRLPISREDFLQLKKQKLVEGRFPNIFVSFEVAAAVGEKTKYIQNRGLDDEVCIELIRKTLKTQPSTMLEILDVLDHGLSATLTPDKKAKKVSNLLQKMKKSGEIYPVGPRNKAVWHLE